MAGTRNAAYWDARIAKTIALIEVYEDALLAIAGGAQTYSLDTGQTRTSVTKANLTSMRTTLDALENRLNYQEHMRYGCGATHVIPAF